MVLILFPIAPTADASVERFVPRIDHQGKEMTHPVVPQCAQQAVLKMKKPFRIPGYHETEAHFAGRNPLVSKIP